MDKRLKFWLGVGIVFVYLLFQPVIEGKPFYPPEALNYSDVAIRIMNRVYPKLGLPEGEENAHALFAIHNVNGDGVDDMFVYDDTLCSDAVCPLALYVGDREGKYHMVQEWNGVKNGWLIPVDNKPHKIIVFGDDVNMGERWIWDGLRYRKEEAENES